MHPRVLLAFAAVYVIWGTTYLGIAVAVETIPALLMAAVRFLVPGVLMLAWVRWRHPETPRPSARDWLLAAAVGLLMLTLGNGLLSIAEERMPSGAAALLVATVPLWLTLLDWLAARGRRPTLTVAGGLLLGLGGVAILGRTDAGWEGGEADPWIAVGVVAGAFAWAVGSLLSRGTRKDVPMHQTVALQMLTGGAFLLAWSALRGEWPGFDWADVSLQSWLALAYLSVFGSVVAFTAYIWLLREVPAPLAGTYAFVNPVVAVVAGALFLDEPLTARLAVAGALIVAAVAAITWDKARAARVVQRGGP